MGMAPDVATFMLPKILPRQKAFELLMTGRRQSAQSLQKLGIVNEVVPADELMECARALAHDLQFSEADLGLLQELGTYINYNGYGPAIEDLHFDPQDLYLAL